MEPVTHLLTGACLARTGFHRRVAYATAAMAVAAEFPDIDTVWRLRGPVAAFAHHRGITHSFIGVPFEAAMLLAATMLWHRWRGAGFAKGNAAPRVPVRWFALYGCLVLALLSHLLLDYTNNYGLRPFLPFSGRWYAASIVFIVDPWILLMLLGGLLLPSLLGLVQQEISGAKQGRASAGPATVSLLLIVMYWGFRVYEHGRATALASLSSLRAPGAVDRASPSAEPSSSDIAMAEESASTVAPAEQRALLSPLKVWASPDPLDPFAWYIASDFGPVYQTATADTRRQELSATHLLYKPELTDTLRTAASTGLGRTYLDWSAMPLLSSNSYARGDSGQVGSHRIMVDFEDMRFANTSPLLRRGALPPLTGQVLLTSSGQVLAQGMDGDLSSGGHVQ